MKKELYRLLDTPSGAVVWQGRAWDVEDVENKAFFDDSPGSLERYTLQHWGRVRVASWSKLPGWVTIYANQCLAPVH